MFRRDGQSTREGLVRDPGYLVLAGVAVLIAVGGAWFAFDASHHTDGWNETDGVVVELRSDSTDDGNDWDTTIRFQDSDGIEYEFDSEYGSSHTAEGTAVNVKYPTRDPQQAETAADRRGPVSGGAMVAFAGLFFAGVFTLRSFRLFAEPDKQTAPRLDEQVGLGPPPPGWQRFHAIHLSKKRWHPPILLTDEDGNQRVRCSMDGIDVFDDHGRTIHLSLDWGPRRRRVTDPSGRQLAQAVKVSSPIRRTSVYKVSWPGVTDARFETRTERPSGGTVRHIGELRRGAAGVDRTRIEYVHTVGDWAGSKRTHRGRLSGVVEASTSLPTEVVALCVLLDMQLWATRSPRDGTWTQKQSSNV